MRPKEAVTSGIPASSEGTRTVPNPATTPDQSPVMHSPAMGQTIQRIRSEEIQRRNLLQEAEMQARRKVVQGD